MTDCPGFVNVKINIWPTSSEYAPIVNYDILISCPPFFSISFSLPLQVADATQSTVENCILECIFEDGKNTHRLLMRPVFDPWRSSERPTKENQMMKQSFGEDDGSLESGTEFDLPTFGVAVLLATSITLTLVWLFCELFHLTKVRRRVRRASSNRGRSLTNHESSAVPPSSSLPRCTQPRRQLPLEARRRFASVRVIMRFIYAFAFTFTVFTSLVNVALRQRVDYSTTTKSRRLTADFEEDSAAYSRSHVNSCLSETTFQLNDTELTSSRRFAAIAEVVVPSITSAQTAAVQWVERTAEQFLADVELGLTRQRRYAQTTSLNHWLLFPRALFNKTTERNDRQSSPIVDNSTAAATAATADAFWTFVTVPPPEVDLSFWTTNVRER